MLPPSVRENLREAWQRGRLVPVLGAGVSKSAGLPDWPELLQRLVSRLASEGPLREAFERETDAQLQAFIVRRLRRVSPIIGGRILRSIVGKAKPFAYHTYMALYDHLIQEPEPSLLIKAIAALSKCSKTFLNYNFDNLLEIACRRIGRTAKAVTAHDVDSSSDVTIYHPHGYLPYGGDCVLDADQSFEEIVLSEDAYHREYANPFSWRNMVQLKCLYEGTGLLVGLSLNDPNLRRILEIASTNLGRKHYMLLCADGVSHLDPAWNSLEGRVLRELGLETVWFQTHDELPGLLAEIVADA